MKSRSAHSSRLRPVLAALAMLALFAPFDAGGQGVTAKIPQSREEIRLSYAPIVKRVAPAVVNIYTRKNVTSAVSPLLQDPFYKRFLGNRNPPTQPGSPQPRRRKSSSLGSGVLVSDDGMIVTNHHVIKSADEITVILSDRRQFKAKIMQKDERTDLAILKIDNEGKPLPFLKFRDSDELEVGDLVLAIGNPFGVGQTVTSGIVSALARTRVGVTDFRSFIQTDAAINPGNSGGALVTMDGRLVGINTAIYSRSGGSVGIGFAIPSNMVSSVVAGARGGKIVRPWLGVAGQNVSADIAASLGLNPPQGMIVNSIYPGSPAAKAGLKIGDVVIRIDGRDIYDGQELRFRMATLKVGGTATLDIIRDTKARTITLPLEPPPRTPAPNPTTLQGRHPLGGAMAANLSPALADERGLGASERGVILIDIPNGSIAQRFRLKPNDLVVTVNGVEIKDVKGLVKLLRQRSEFWEVILERRGRKFRIAANG